MQLALPPITIGWVIALLILVLCVVFIAVGKLDTLTGALIGGVALSRLC